MRFSCSFGKMRSNDHARSSDSNIVRDSYDPTVPLAQTKQTPLALTLADKLPLKLVQKLKRQLVLGGERFLPDNRFHSSRVSSYRILGILHTRGLMNKKTPRIQAQPTSWLDTSPWSFLVSSSPIALFISRESDGSTLMGGYICLLCNCRSTNICPSVM